jgi:DNA-binding response OmpR family regulator
MKPRVLYVEDEPFLGKIVNETLQLQGFETLLVTDGAEVMSKLEMFKPDICVLDIMLPNIDGYSLCREIRKQFPQLPVIFLTARSETGDLVKGFEAGGTDYIRKPFSMEELIVRIKNQLNLHDNKSSIEPDQKQIGSYRLDMTRYELTSPGGSYKLSFRDMEVLSMLIEAPNRVVDRKSILMKVWGDDSYFNSRTLDVYINKLRNMFSEDPCIELVTLKGKGYLFLVKNCNLA